MQPEVFKASVQYLRLKGNNYIYFNNNFCGKKLTSAIKCGIFQINVCQENGLI